MEDGCIVRVIKDFLTINEGELCVTKGEFLQVLYTVDRHWVHCKVEHREGIVPASHITPQDLEDLDENQTIYLAQCAIPVRPDLTVRKGTLIIGLEEPQNDWFRGKTLEGDVGTFNVGYCWQMDPTNYKKHKARTLVEKFAQVIHPMTAQLVEEIDLEKGQIVTITEIIDKDWYRGESKGRTGIFPASFVRIIDSFPGSAPPPSADLTMYLNASSNNSSRGNNDYMNTRNAFVGLEENLRALVPAHESSKIVFGRQGAVHKFGRTMSLIEQDDYFKRNLPPSYAESVFGHSSKVSQGFEELSQGLSVFSEQKIEPKVVAPSLDYTNLSKNLSVFESFNEEQSLFNTLLGRHNKRTSTGAICGDPNNNSGNNTNEEQDDFRYQNITCENLGYTGSGVDVRPYGIAKYTFVAQFLNELSLNAGEMVYLSRYVDCEWLEGHIDGKSGIFPISYVNIIVDCAGIVEPYKSTAVTVHENLKTDTFHKVLYNFQAQIDGDLSVAEGEVVQIKDQHNTDWVVVENSFGEVGLCPGNHLDPSPDFCGKALFDIERLLSFKAQTDKPEPGMLKSTAPKPELKFFDPLCSPDHEMLRIEAELERKAREANSINVQQKIIGVKTMQRAPSDASSSFKPPSKKDLDTLISSNLSKIAALNAISAHAKTASNKNQAVPFNKPFHNSVPPQQQPQQQQQPLQQFKNANGKLDFSESVLAELRGRQQPPPRPAEPPKVAQMQSPLKPQTIMQLEPKGNTQMQTPMKPKTAPVLATTAKPSEPAKPSTPLLMKRPAPTRPPPPPPVAKTPPGNPEPLYASVKKDSRKEIVRNLPPLPVRPPRPPSPNLIHSPPPPPPPLESPIHSNNVTVTSDAFSRDFIVTCADIHAEDYATSTFSKNGGKNSSDVITPTNETIRNVFKKVSHKYVNLEETKVPSDGDSPNVPARTSSAISQHVLRGETFRSYINLKEIDAAQNFPPDRQSPGECNGIPPKVPPTLSVRSTGSIKSSRTPHYTPVASERCFDSPTPSSLHHSYETLNTLYDTSSMGNDINEDGSMTGNGSQKLPHRPAPPVPSSKMNGTNFPAQNMSSHSGDDIQKFDSVSNKKKSRHPMSRRTLRQRKIHSLRRQIQIKEKMLESLFVHKEQLLRELDMYQEIAVAKGPEYDSLNQSMDHCQESIETLSDEIQRLQACLGDEEMTLEEDSIEESRRRAEDDQRKALMEVQRREEEKRAKEEKIRKNRERRENVISELVVTEREFCRDLKLTWQAFGLDTPAMLEQRGVDVPTLFGNVADVIDISERFLDTLQEEVKSKSSPEEQMVGRCFLQHSETMKLVYTEYCINHDKAEQLLEKYDQVQEIQRMLQKGVETLQSQVSCFNMGSILIKPVQRILKYPLILNELIKCTEEVHRDRKDLLDAVSIMSDVASFINESKRRKDIIDKYKSEEDKTLTRRISKLNMHSIGKKSSRISQRFLSTIGIDPVNRNLDFDELEKRFSNLIRSVQAFAIDSQRFKEQLHETVVSQYNIAETVVELYKDKSHLREVERFRSAHKKVLSTVWNEFNTKMDPRVVKPLSMLIETFQGPTRLIQKRHDKQLDYQASQQKAEKNRDPNRTRSLTDDVEKCRSTFEALNSQLLEELPKLLTVATSIFTDSVSEFVLLRKIFVGKVTKELLSLMDLPLLASTTGDILEGFLVKHSLVCSQIGRFSFCSKAFKPEDKKVRSQSPNGQQLGHKSLDVASQSANVRTALRGKYAAAKLYQANQLYVPSDLLDIGINPGDLVGVVQKKDPMGSDKRWFVDNGLTQGFVPCHILTAFGENAENQTRPEPSPTWPKLSPTSHNSRPEPSQTWPKLSPTSHNSRPVIGPKPDIVSNIQEVSHARHEQVHNIHETVPNFIPEMDEDVLEPEMPINDPVLNSPEHAQAASTEDSDQIHSYDDVAADEEENKKPVRKAPPVPKMSVDEEVEDVEASKNSIEGPVVSNNIERVCQNTLERPKNNTEKSKSESERPKHDVERVSHHSYEEIAASEANSEPSQDLSPIYEEIHGGSRSSISGTSCSSGGSRSVISTGSSTGKEQGHVAGCDQGLAISPSGIERGKFYYALYEFSASEASMIHLFRGQVVRVVHLTGGDWCYVEDRHCTKGYVPCSYLKLYQAHQSNGPTAAAATNNNNKEEDAIDIDTSDF